MTDVAIQKRAYTSRETQIYSQDQGVWLTLMKPYQNVMTAIHDIKIQNPAKLGSTE
jgi:hypothetical protein